MSKLQAQARSVTSINQQTHRFISARTEVNFTVPVEHKLAAGLARLAVAKVRCAMAG